VRREDIWTLVVRQAKDNKRPASWPSNGVDCFNHLAQLCHEQLGIDSKAFKKGKDGVCGIIDGVSVDTLERRYALWGLSHS